MKKVKTPRDAKGAHDLKSRPTTTQDVTSRQVPIRTARNVRHSHIVRGRRDIARMGWEPREQVVAESLRSVDELLLDRANRYHHALEQVRVLLDTAQRRGTELEAANEELQATNEELEATSEELERTNAYRQTLMNTMLDILMTTDQRGVITEVNRATEDISGYSREELVGQPFRQFFLEPDRAHAGIEQVLVGKRVSNYDLTLLTKDGLHVAVSYNATALRDPDGSITGVLGSSRDVTELKRAEEVLRESEAHLRAAMDNMTDGVVTIDDRGLVGSFNRAAQRIFGYEPAEVIGQNVKMLMPEPYYSEHDSYLSNYLRTGERKIIGIGREVVGRRKDGSTFPLDLAVGEMRSGQEPMFIGVLRDISLRKEREEMLTRQAAELTRSNEELQQFAYVASHDLQEPLRMISSYSQLLARRYRGNLDADADEFITYIVDGVSRMQSLINGLLAYSRVGTNGSAFEPTDCATIVDLAVSNLQAAIEESGAVVTHDALPTVMADASQLSQVFQNLIGNAIKFRGEHPPRLHVSAQGKENAWLFSVRDNGLGIDPQYADRIFGLFQRLHSRTEYPGTGLGLAICKKIVERHGGRIWVESEPGKGATFYITFPTVGDNQ
ncbi:MAG: PAS domain S-box protein [Nitrospinae bacterium]|nr:PAS domain S-box protein [Nitrospinota bacterium]